MGTNALPCAENIAYCAKKYELGNRLVFFIHCRSNGISSCVSKYIISRRLYNVLAICAIFLFFFYEKCIDEGKFFDILLKIFYNSIKSNSLAICKHRQGEEKG